MSYERRAHASRHRATSSSGMVGSWSASLTDVSTTSKQPEATAEASASFSPL
jgi:hypothetical protein